MSTEIIRVPDIGMDTATCIEVSVKPGDRIDIDDTLIVLESDKASMDVPAPIAGTVTNVKVAEGDTLSEGTEIMEVEVSADNNKEEATPEATPAPQSDKQAKIETVSVPDIGMDSAKIIEIAVKVGDHVSEEDTLVILESDKASMDVPSPISGEIVSIKVSEGEDVSEGHLLVEVKTQGNASPESEQNQIPQDNASNESATQEVTVPDIGMDSAKIIEIAIAPGDKIKEEDTLVVLESDKASMDVPSPFAGEVIQVAVNEGQDVSQGTLLVLLKTEGKTASVAATKETSTTAKGSGNTKSNTTQNTSTKTLSNTNTTPSKNVHAGPAVRKLAREFGVDLALVPGTGPRKRILKDDVANWVKNQLNHPQQSNTSAAGLPTVPDQDFSQYGPIETHPLSRIQQLTAANMVRNALVIPHVTQFDEADVTDTEQFRQSLKPEMEKRGIKISPLAFIVKACASALENFPNVNVSLLSDGLNFVQKKYIHIGIAVDTPNGLIVPVIKDANKKSLWEIAETIIDFAKRGRDGKIKPNEMQGGCFTVSSLGGLGGTAFTPIIHAPEVAILGVSKNAIKPHWNGTEFVPRTFTPLSLSYDHRAINGADAAKFTTYICTVLADVRRLIL